MNDEKSSILWVILPPEVRERFAAFGDKQEALPERFAKKQLKRLKCEPLYQKWFDPETDNFWINGYLRISKKADDSGSYS